MELKIVCIGPSSIDSVTYIVGKISQDRYVVFSPLKKPKPIDNFNPNDFSIFDTIDLDTNIIGPTDAFNKTKNKSVDICIHEVNITADEIKENYLLMIR